MIDFTMDAHEKRAEALFLCALPMGEAEDYWLPLLVWPGWLFSHLCC
jgi:hypothetical protein